MAKYKVGARNEATENINASTKSKAITKYRKTYPDVKRKRIGAVRIIDHSF